MNPQSSRLHQHSSASSSQNEPKTQSNPAIGDPDPSLMTSSQGETELEKQIQFYYQVHFKPYKAPSIDHLLSSSSSSTSSSNDSNGSHSPFSFFGAKVRFPTVLAYGLTFGLVCGLGFMIWQPTSISTPTPLAHHLTQGLNQDLNQDLASEDSSDLSKHHLAEQVHGGLPQTQADFLSYGTALLPSDLWRNALEETESNDFDETDHFLEEEMDDDLSASELDELSELNDLSELNELTSSYLAVETDAFLFL